MKKGCLWTSKHDCRLCTADCAVRECDYNPKQAMEKFAIPTPRKRDEIDEWLEKECNYHMGSCSSIEELKYSVAREVAEKLWKKKEKTIV